MKLAFLGLGNMGSAIALKLLDAGHKLTVWNRTAAKAEPLIAHAAKLAATPAEAIKGAEIVFTALMDDASVYALFASEQTRSTDAPVPSSLFASFAANASHVCLSTISPVCADWLESAHKANGSGFLSAPVLGRPDTVAAGQLVQLLAGDTALMDRAEPVCLAYAARVVRLDGPPHTANNQKLCVNFFLISTIESIGESLILAEKLGADRAKLLGFIESVYAHAGFKGYATKLGVREIESDQGFSMAGAAKDARLIRAAAQAVNCPVEIADAVSVKMDELVARGFGSLDIAAVQEISRQKAGLDSKIE